MEYDPQVKKITGHHQLLRQHLLTFTSSSTKYPEGQSGTQRSPAAEFRHSGTAGRCSGVAEVGTVMAQRVAVWKGQGTERRHGCYESSVSFFYIER